MATPDKISTRRQSSPGIGGAVVCAAVARQVQRVEILPGLKASRRGRLLAEAVRAPPDAAAALARHEAGQQLTRVLNWQRLPAGATRSAQLARPRPLI
jgi:hypothetical protein